MVRTGVDEFLGRRIRKIRQERGLTLRAVQQRARVSATHVSEIERGKTSPTVGVLERIASALSVRASALLDAPPGAQPLQQTGETRRRASLARGGAVIEGLTLNHGTSELSVHLVSLTPDCVLFTEEAHEGEEFCYVLEGMLEVRLDGVPYIVRSGEGLHFRPRATHEVRNPTGNPVRFIWAGRPRAAL